MSDDNTIKLTEEDKQKLNEHRAMMRKKLGIGDQIIPAWGDIQGFLK